MTSLPWQGHFARFLAVGTCGFIVDAACFQLLFEAGGGLVYSRLISAAVAISVTWLLNRRYVFRTTDINRSGPEYGRHVVVQLGGLAVNFAVYFGFIAVFPGLRTMPLLALAAGSAVALAFNFAGSRWWAFRPRSVLRQDS